MTSDDEAALYLLLVLVGVAYLILYFATGGTL
jgi:hypothetical protein